MSWTNIFGGSAVAPSTVQYLALALSSNLTLVWPLESAEGQNYLAQQIDVTPSGGGFSINMPPANTGSKGIQTVATNKGASSFTFKDNVGTQIQVVAAGETYIISLTDNSSVAGVWEAIKLGAAAPSGSIASALAGAGLQASGTQLQSNIVTNTYAANHGLTVANRATANNWTGAAGTLTLDPLSTLGTGWWAIVANRGTSVLTVATSGADTIDGGSSIAIPVAGTPDPYSTLIVAGASGFTAYFLPPTPPTGIWAIAGGTADNLTATYAQPIPALTDGLLLAFRAAAPNVATTPTFSPNGLTQHNITMLGGRPLNQGSIAGAGYECFVRYRLATTSWELLNPWVTPPLTTLNGATLLTTATWTTILSAPVYSGIYIVSAGLPGASDGTLYAAMAIIASNYQGSGSATIRMVLDGSATNVQIRVNGAHDIQVQQLSGVDQQIQWSILVIRDAAGSGF